MPSVFISYSHDFPAHSKRVLTFANALRSHGVETELDQFHKYDLHHWPEWCAEQIEPGNHDYVLCICTEEYLLRLKNKVPSNVGKGVWWEGQHLIDEIYNDKDNRRFISIQFDSEDLDAIHTVLRNYTRFTISQFDHDSDAGYKSLLRLLFGKSEIRQEPVGAPPAFLDDDFDIGETTPAAPQLPAKAAETNFHAVVNERIRFGRVYRYVPDRLIGREGYLKDLDNALKRKSTRIVSIVAFGGVGKTSLIAKWLDKLGGRGWKGITNVFAWSFYSQGTRQKGGATADEFLREALIHFGDRELAESNASAWNKGERLAQLADAVRSLIVLDGLEPLQHPQGPLDGMLQDQGIEALLTTLARSRSTKYGGALCVITTRESVCNLHPFRSTSVDEWTLETLDPEAGAALLYLAGATRVGDGAIKSDDSLLIATSKELGGHALTLQLLGSYLKRAWGGDLRKQDLIDFSKANAATLGGHAFRVMEAYEKWLADGNEAGARQLAVLRLLGLFDRPATADCLDALRCEPAIKGVTEPLIGLAEEDWNVTLSDLQSSHLIQMEIAESEQHPFGAFSSAQPALDAHPLMREYFAQQLLKTKSEAFYSAHSRLFDHLSETTPYRPDSLSGLQPLYQAMKHGCLAGRQQEAFDNVFEDRIQRGTETFSTKKLGAMVSDLGAAAVFFEEPWKQPSQNLNETAQAELLHNAGFYLRALGRLHEAVEPMRMSCKLFSNQQNWGVAAHASSNLSELEATLGLLNEAANSGMRAINFAVHSDDWKAIRRDKAITADVLHQKGKKDKAKALFEEAERIQAKQEPNRPILHGVGGFRFIDLLLVQAEQAAWRCILRVSDDSGGAERSTNSNTVKSALATCNEVNQRASSTLKWFENQFGLLSIALDHLSRARALLYTAIISTSSMVKVPEADYTPWFRKSELKNEISLALSGLRQSGDTWLLPLALLNTAFSEAWAIRERGLESKNCKQPRIQTNQLHYYLDEAQQIAERGPMPLYLADVHLHRARIFRDRDELAKARALIEKHEYWRRREELEDAEEAAERFDWK